MNKFSKLGTKKKETNVLYKGSYMNVVDLEGWEVVSEKDMVICLPYLVNNNTVILRMEDIPPYKERYSAEHFFTVMSGGIEEGESKIDAVRRELAEECGIAVNSTVDIEFRSPLMVSKGNTAQYHICLLPLSQYDYTEVKAVGDGSKHEANSGIVQVQIKDLHKIPHTDLITAYTLNLLLQEYGTL
jgi:8-oxo-dGTP pyrophosphatase MutT (NUDIX family)